MKTTNVYFKKHLSILLFLTFSLFNINLINSASANTIDVTTATTGDATIVFVANGRFQSTDGSILKNGIVNGDGIHFQKNLMNRTNDQIKQHQQLAVEFFNQRFGIDVATDPAIIFTGYEMDPRINLKAFTIAGEKVPNNGYPVDDGGWAVVVTDPSGITLGGDWDGFHVPVNTMLLFGEVVINTETENIVIHYQSDTPFILDQFSAAQVRFKAQNDQFGSGSIGGVARLIVLDPSSNKLQVDIKNVLTAPGIVSGI